MNQARDRGGGRVVIHHSFTQSRYEKGFEAAAYEIIVPQIRHECVDGRRKKQAIAGEAATHTWRERSCV